MQKCDEDKLYKYITSALFVQTENARERERERERERKKKKKKKKKKKELQHYVKNSPAAFYNRK